MQDSKIDIVVIDDSQDAAAAMAMALELDGYSVRVAHTGAEGLQLIDSLGPHCVLLDFALPDTDGLELTRQLRARFGDDIVLIAVTGHSADNERVADTFAQVDHYFTKPVTAAQIRKLLSPLA